MSPLDVHAVIRERSKSFALAARFLPAAFRDDITVVYAWCRRVDDAVDEVPACEAAHAIPRLVAEVDALYSDQVIDGDPLLEAMRDVARRRGIPREYPLELVRGMEMDALQVRYENLEQLLAYCWRVAGTVGLMVCHVMGIVSPDALRRASHLGMAMQLTNVCRDVAEDWQRGRLYLPASLLRVAPTPHGPTGAEPAVAALLEEASRLYRSGDVGITALPFRCRVAVRTARLVYSAIGSVIAARGYDVNVGRAFVTPMHKAWLACVAFVQSLLDLARTKPSAERFGVPRPTRYPHDVLPV